MTNLESQVLELKDEVARLREDIKQLIVTCSRMDHHISFVDNVYSIVQKPLEFIINSFWGQSKASLPQSHCNRIVKI